MLSAVGLGAIVVKILDIVWLQRMVRNNEVNKWKRDQKIKAYSKLANDLISQQEWGSNDRSPEIYKLLGEIYLLLESQDLVTRLDLFYKDSKKSLKIFSEKKQHAEHYGDSSLTKRANDFHKSENLRLQKEAGEILVLLRKDMFS